MVKNLKGGNKAKNQGRKYTSNTSVSALRLSLNKLEVYACVTKLFGQGRCLVQTVDDSLGQLQCVIRHKFKKRNSNVLIGSIILIGLRDWEGPDNFKICDLLELYDKDDIYLLKSIPTTLLYKLDKFIDSFDNQKINDFDFSLHNNDSHNDTDFYFNDI